MESSWECVSENAWSLTRNTRRQIMRSSGSYMTAPQCGSGNYLPLDTRMQLYAPVRELAGLGLSYRQIRDAVLKAHQVRLPKSTISVWVNGLHDPTGRLNSFRPNPTPELAYVIGAILGDGNLNIHGYNAELILAVTDYDFAKEFSASLATILDQPKPYKVRWHPRKNR